MKSSLPFLVGLALFFSVPAFGQEAAEKRVNLALQVSNFVAAAWSAEVPELRLENAFKLQERRNSSEAHPYRPGEERDRASTVSWLSINFTSEAGPGTIDIKFYDSEEEASFWFRRGIREFTVQPPRVLDEIGDEGVHFGDALTNGTLLFRRGTITVWLNAKQEATSLRLAHTIDTALRAARRKVSK